ncbi:MAG: caspase family protein [Phycisphaerae bacterium]
MFHMEGTADEDVYIGTYTVDAPWDVAWKVTTGIPNWLEKTSMVKDVRSVGGHGTAYWITWKDGTAQRVIVDRDRAKGLVQISFVPGQESVGSVAACSIVLKPFFEHSTLVEAEIRITNSLANRLASLIVLPVGVVAVADRDARLRRFWRELADSHRTASADLLAQHHALTGRTHIIAVGVGSSHESDKWEPLQFAEKDAADFYEWATNIYPAVPSDKTLVRALLTGQAANAKNLGKTLDQLQQKVGFVKPGDMIIFYFAGHVGLLRNDAFNRGKSTPYLITANADPDSLRYTAVKRDRVQEHLDLSDAVLCLVFYDACYSGGARLGNKAQLPAVRTRGRVQDRPEFSRREKTVVIAAAGQLGLAAESDELQQGIFTYALLRGLSGFGDWDRDGNVTIVELSDFIEVEVEKYTEGRQRPFARIPQSARSLQWPVPE